MRRGLNWTGIAQLLVVLVGAASLKFHYSTASVNDLRWILAPTAQLVELVTGTQFEYEAYGGYLSDDRTYLIAASCAGVNFMIAAFLMLTLGELWRSRRQKLRWIFFPAALIVSYVVTLVANTIRISVGLLSHHSPFENSWIDSEQLHRFEGISIYSGFLLLLFFAAEAITKRRDQTRFPALHPAPLSTEFRRFLLPLIIYYAVTLGIPLANGAHRYTSDFWEHSLFVLLTPLLFVLPLTALRIIQYTASAAR